MSACARGDHTAGPAASIQQLELNAGRVDRAPHEAAERIDLAHEMPLGRAADRRIARHERHGVRRERAESHATPDTRRRPRRLDTGVAGADDDDIEVGHSSRS